MSVLQSVPLSDSALKIRWLEQYVSAGINQKSVAANPKGVIAGFRVIPNAGMVVTVQMDPTLNLSVANVLETSSGPFSLTVIQNSNVNIDLTLQQNLTIFITLDVVYATTTPTTGYIRVVNAAELVSNPDLVVLAKINVPASPGPILTSHINMGYRLSAGDFTPMESYQAFNQVGNSSFENNTIFGWTNNGFDSAAASTDTARTGIRSLKLVKAVSGTPDISSTFLFAMPGCAYKVGAWFRSIVALTGGGAKLQVSWFNSAGTIIGSPIDIESAFTGGIGTFTQVLAEVTAPALAYYAQIRVFFNTSSGTLYVDDVQFTSYGNSTLSLRLFEAANLRTPNTFTQINTFNNGISVAAGNVALGAGNVTFAASLQTVAWPNWVLQQLDDKNYKIEATDAFAVVRNFNLLARTIGGPPDMKFEMENPLTPYTFKIETGFFTSASARIGSEQDGGIRIRQNAGDRWLFSDSFNNYDLVAGGSQVANITNLRPPSGFTEATRRNYVDSQRRNLIINGHMGIWQRQSALGVGPDTPLSVAAGGRSYLPDRWYLHVNAGTAAGEISRQLVSGPPYNFKYAVRCQRPSGATGTNLRNLAQEIERGYLRLLNDRGGFASTVVLRFWCRAGADFSGTLQVGAVSGIFSALESQWFGIYSGGSINSLNPIVPTTSWQQFTMTKDFNNSVAAAMVFRHTPSGTAGTNDWFEVTGVEVIEVGFGVTADLDVAQGNNSIPFTYSGGSEAGEVELCQRFYEKSYDIAVPPGTITNNGHGRIMAGNAGSGYIYSPGVHYRTRKHPFAPSYQNWFTFDPTTGNGGPGVGNLAFNHNGGVADFSLDSPNAGGEAGFTINPDTVPSDGDVLALHWTSDCDI